MSESKNYSPVLISIFCIGIIFFILFTQCEVSNIRLKPKDASLVLIFLALLAYINNYNWLFILLLGVFIFIYFAPSEYVNKIFSPFIKQKKEVKSIIKKPKKVQIIDNIETPENMSEVESEITLDTDIELDDNIEEVDEVIDIVENPDLAGPQEDLYLNAKKRE